MKIISLLVILMVIVANMLMAVSVYADTPNPDSPPTVEEFNVYRNLLETGDFLLVIYANIPYATLPDYSVDYTFIWRLIDTDNTTELGSTTGYGFWDDGYGYNVFSIYLSASDAPTWGQAYTVKLSGNPSQFDDPPIYNFYLSTADYSSLTDTADVKAELAARILNIATDLNIKWGVDSAYFLTTEIETGTVLSLYGEAFFRGAIYGLQGMAPAAFSYVFGELDIEERDWDTAYSGNLTEQWTGTWVEDAKEAGQTLFGTDYDLLSVIMAVALCLGAAIASVMVAGDAWNGMLDASVVGVMVARLGMFGLGYWGLLCFVCIVYIGMRIWKPFG